MICTACQESGLVLLPILSSALGLLYPISHNIIPNQHSITSMCCNALLTNLANYDRTPAAREEKLLEPRQTYFLDSIYNNYVAGKGVLVHLHPFSLFLDYYF